MIDVIKKYIKGNLKWIIMASIIVIIIIALAGFSYVLKLIDSSNPNHSSSWGANSSSAETNMNAQVETNVTSQISIKNIISKDNGDYKYDIDLGAQVDEIYNKLNETEAGRRTLGYIEGSEEEQKNVLKDMIRAEIITQYPDLRSVSNMGKELDDDEVQGCIRFKRMISEPTIKKVTTIEKSEDTSIELNGGIACWGDDFTLGNVEDSSDNYPTKLAEAIQKNTYNLGFQGVTSTEIALMVGADGYIFKVAGEKVTLASEVNSEVNISTHINKNDTILEFNPFSTFDGSSDKKILKCSIKGVEGELTCKDETYTFKRISSGDEITIEAGTEITINTQNEYSKAFPIIWIGNNNSFINYENDNGRTNLINNCWSIINMSEDPDNYIVIIPIFYRTPDGQIKKYEEKEYEKMKEAFLENSGFNSKQVLDLYSQISTGYEYDIIVSEIEKCLNDNNIKTQITGDYTQASNDEIIALSDEYLPSDGSNAITLEYIPLGNKVEPAPGTLMWMINNDDDEIKKASMQYFSLDDAGNVVVANWTKVTTTVEKFTDNDGNRDNYVYDEGYPTDPTVEYTITPVKVNYKSSVSSYTMPFDYLWALLVMGDDTEFVKNLTKLTLDSKIEATLYDELSVIDNDVVDELTNGYRTHYKEVSTDYGLLGMPIFNSENTEEWDEVRYEDKKNHTKVVTETNKVRYKLTYADVWFLTYTVSGVQRQEYKGDETNTSASVGGAGQYTAKSDKVEIDSKRSTKIKAIVTVPENCEESMPLVIMCHGFTGFREGDDNHFIQLGTELAKCGIASITANFPGCGREDKSDEPFTNYTLENMKDDLDSIKEYMISTYSNIDSSQIGIVGHSMGGRLVSEYLDTSGIKAAALWSPANGDGMHGLSFIAKSPERPQSEWNDEIDRIYSEEFTDKNSYYSSTWGVEVSKDLFDQMANSHPQQKITNFINGGGKIYVAYGTADDVIPQDVQDSVESVVGKSFHTYAGADHNLTNTSIVSDTLNFLAEAFGKNISNTSENINDLYQKTVVPGGEPYEWQESGPKRGPTETRTPYPNYIQGTFEEDEQFIEYTITTHEEQDYTLVKDHVTTTIIIKSGYKYTTGVVSTKEKTDKNYTEEEMETGNFKEPNFVKYFLYASTARNSISSTYSWLFTSLENNPRTESMVDITKYMIYKATDKDLGVNNFDFNVYNEDDFKDATDFVISEGNSVIGDINMDDSGVISDGKTTLGGYVGGVGIGEFTGEMDGTTDGCFWNTYRRRDGREFKLYCQNGGQSCLERAKQTVNSGFKGSFCTELDPGGTMTIQQLKPLILDCLKNGGAVVMYADFNKGTSVKGTVETFYCSDGGCHAISLLDIDENGHVFIANPYYSPDGKGGQKAGGWSSFTLYELMDNYQTLRDYQNSSIIKRTRFFTIQ